MKKNIFALILLAFFSIFTFTACNSDTSVKASFDSEEYIVSIDDTLDFYTQVKTEGVNKKELKFVPSNENVLQTSEDGKLVAKASGESYVFAKYYENIVSKTKVVVRYVQSLPLNFVFSDDAVLSWDKSFVYVSGENVFADEYVVAYAKDDSEEYTEKTIQTNSIAFEEEGTYSFKVKAVSLNDYILDSDWASGTFNYGTTGKIENIVGEVNQVWNDQNIKVSWDEKEDCVYDVFIDGFKIFKDIETNSFTFDCSVFAYPKTVKVEVVAKDKNGILFDTSTKFNIVMMSQPSIQYQVDSYNAYLTITELDWVDKIIQRYSDGYDTTEKVLEGKNNIAEYMLGKPMGIYEMQVMGVGGTDDDGNIYLNSKLSENVEFAKLATPKFNVSFSGKTLNITFEDDSYVTQYRFTYGDRSVVYNIEHGATFTADLSDFVSGLYHLEVVALPSFDNGDIVPFTFNGKTTENIIMSDGVTSDFYVVEEIAYASHSFNQHSGVSTFSLPHIDSEGGYFYKMYINNIAVSTAIESTADNHTTFSLSSISEYPVNAQNEYVVRFVYGHKTSEDVVDGTISEYTKTLKILDAPTATVSYPNGSFAWDAAADNCVYVYEIYESDSNYESMTLINSALTSNTYINEILPFGYYIIRVYANSGDYNRYLDSDYLGGGYLQEQIIVTSKISSPSFTFGMNGRNYVLNISNIQYAGKFDVYVNGQKEGSATVLNPSNLTSQYQFTQRFSRAGQYLIEVSALSGTLYDSTIHLESDKSSIIIEKVSAPTYEIEEVYNADGVKIHENLIVTQIEQALYCDVKLNGVKINQGNENVVDLMDYSTFGNDFALSLKNIGVPSSVNHYYIDSAESYISLMRVSAPTQIEYRNGIITFEIEDYDSIDDVYIKFVAHTPNGDMTLGLLAGDLLSHTGSLFEFDYQRYFDSLDQDSNELRIAESFDISLSAHKIGYDDNLRVYVLPSIWGTTTSGESVLSIAKLETPEIEFNASTRTLSWEIVGNAETTYNIFVDGELTKENYTANSISLSDLGLNDQNLLITKEIYIVALNKNYLNSEESNTIKVKEVEKVNALTIAKQNNGWVASVAVLNDTAYIQNISVNGSTANVHYVLGESGAYFNFSDFDGITNFSIVVIAKETVGDTYYLNSVGTTFNVYNLASRTFAARVEDDNIVYDDISNGFVGIGADEDPIVYTLVIRNGVNEYTIENSGTSIGIQTLERETGVVFNGQIEVQVYAKVEKTYTLTPVGGSAIGYYGEKTSSVLTIDKLEQVLNISKEIKENSSLTTQIAKVKDSYVVLSWNDEWSAYSNVLFNIAVKAGAVERSFVVKAGDRTEKMELALENNVYSLLLKGELLTANLNTVSIQVVCAGSIQSVKTEYAINRLNDVEDVTVSDEGILSITDNQNVDYLVQVVIDENTYETTLSAGNLSIDLLDSNENILFGYNGQYIINVLAYDAAGNVMPALNTIEINGYKLQGISSSSISDKGEITLNLYSDELSRLEWHA